MEKQQINDIEEKVYEEILTYMSDNKQPPMRTELANILSDDDRRFSPQLVQYYLSTLQKKGWIKVEKEKKEVLKFYKIYAKRKIRNKLFFKLINSSIYCTKINTRNRLVVVLGAIPDMDNLSNCCWGIRSGWISNSNNDNNKIKRLN